MQGENEPKQLKSGHLFLAIYEFLIKLLPEKNFSGIFKMMTNIFFTGNDPRNEVKEKEGILFFACTVCKFGAKA